MEDEAIIALYFARDQRALAETGAKYGGFLLRLSQNILGARQDAEECVNDAYLRAWNAMPPERPAFLGTWLGRIVRNLSLDRWKRERAQKRGGGETEILLGELAECVPAPHGVEKSLEDREAAKALEDFLRALPADRRDLFLRRYWYGESIADIAGRYGCGAGRVKSALYRTRQALRAYLEKEGIAL